MKVGMLHQLENAPGLLVIPEFESKLAVDMPETLYPAIFPGGNNSSCLKLFGFPSSHILRIVQLVGPPVLECTIRMNSRFMRKGVCPYARLSYRDRNVECVRGIP